MKVLFLDFDGVLNSKQHYLATKDVKIKGVEDPDVADLLSMKKNVNYNNMWVLGYILKKVPDLKIVISSAWGLHFRLDQFKELFKIFKLDPERVIDITPRKMSSARSMEVGWWLELQKEKTPDDPIHFITVDDHIIFDINDPRKVNEYTMDAWTGLTMRDAFKIIQHFDPKFQEPELFI